MGIKAGGIVATAIVMAVSVHASAAPQDWLKSSLNKASAVKLSDTQVGAGLKEALSVGIQNTIALLGKNDGYYANEAVKVLLPAGMKKAEPALRSIGFGPKLDEFILSMNRAAEKAAPLASDIFAEAITGMSFDDVQKVFKGGPHAATDYLKEKTAEKLRGRFQPAVRFAMGEFAVTRKYDEIAGAAKTLPLVGKYVQGMEIDSYVTGKALDGLFTVLGQQEAKIRSDPAARVTDILKQVFK